MTRLKSAVFYAGLIAVGMLLFVGFAGDTAMPRFYLVFGFLIMLVDLTLGQRYVWIVSLSLAGVVVAAYVLFAVYPLDRAFETLRWDVTMAGLGGLMTLLVHRLTFRP